MGDNKTIADDFGVPESIFEEKVTHEYNGKDENESMFDDINTLATRKVQKQGRLNLRRFSVR